jgi:Cd2+/Zn2+-exporting ATPase
MNEIASLKALGFTEHEAKAYVALLGASECNGYEVAKASGIARANVYPVLERLVERQAARRLENSNGHRYVAMPLEPMLARLERQHRQRVGAAREALTELETAPRSAAVFNLRGRDELLAEARDVLESVRERLLVAIQPTEAAVLAPELAGARERGVAITTLCMEACPRECGGCTGDIHRCQLASPGKRWLLLVADEERVLAGEMQGATTQAIATEQRLVAELAAAYIRQSLVLATVGGALGERFEGLLSLEARRILDGLHPEGGFIDWLHRVTGGETV